MTNSIKLSRREFARGTALAAAVAAVMPTGLLAQATTPSGKRPESPAPAAGPPELSPSAKAEAAQSYLAVIQKYGDRFTETQKKDIARLLELQQRSIEAVRAFALENGDAPALIFEILD